MPEGVFVGFAIVIFITMLLGFIRVERGPTAADRMLAAQLFGTTGVALMLLLAEAFQVPALRDVALVLALLAAVTGIAFVKRANQIQGSETPGGTVS
ncbi:MAG: monovalent cation/H+ antiporter complex subunit F [Actinobacteria bacterium]|nr:monovalent cation/H+ antiporter complex subunit F [Actinomycetota bacterium]MCL5888230.1 monovalent cation/H+ antiporter complex subunit F [Actinomycetota bacterium]